MCNLYKFGASYREGKSEFMIKVIKRIEMFLGLYAWKFINCCKNNGDINNLDELFDDHLVKKSLK